MKLPGLNITQQRGCNVHHHSSWCVIKDSLSFGCIFEILTVWRALRCRPPHTLDTAFCGNCSNIFALCILCSGNILLVLDHLLTFHSHFWESLRFPWRFCSAALGRSSYELLWATSSYGRGRCNINLRVQYLSWCVWLHGFKPPPNNIFPFK